MELDTWRWSGLNLLAQAPLKLHVMESSLHLTFYLRFDITRASLVYVVMLLSYFESLVCSIL